jgi:hypothetical protein
MIKNFRLFQESNSEIDPKKVQIWQGSKEYRNLQSENEIDHGELDDILLEIEDSTDLEIKTKYISTHLLEDLSGFRRIIQLNFEKEMIEKDTISKNIENYSNWIGSLKSDIDVLNSVIKRICKVFDLDVVSFVPKKINNINQNQLIEVYLSGIYKKDVSDYYQEWLKNRKRVEKDMDIEEIAEKAYGEVIEFMEDEGINDSQEYVEMEVIHSIDPSSPIEVPHYIIYVLDESIIGGYHPNNIGDYIDWAKLDYICETIKNMQRG